MEDIQETQQQDIEEVNGGYDEITDDQVIDFNSFLRSDTPEMVSMKLLESTYGDIDFMKRDMVDKFLDFIYFKVQTGYYDIINMAYPTRRMNDKKIEEIVIEMINEHLYPEIILRLLKFFSRNIYDSDSNLYVANLIHSELIIQGIFETFKLFKKDIFIADMGQRSLNVKRVQQFSPRSDDVLSSPLDATCRLKYILAFFAFKFNVDHIYTEEDILLGSYKN